MINTFEEGTERRDTLLQFGVAGNSLSGEFVSREHTPLCLTFAELAFYVAIRRQDLNRDPSRYIFNNSRRHQQHQLKRQT